MYPIVVIDSTIENLAAVIIRPATEDDLDQIATIYAGYVTDTVITFELTVPSAAEWQRRFSAITTAGLPFLVAASSDDPARNRILGYAYCAPWKSREAYRQTAEDSIYLATEARGQGLGGKLLDALITAARSAGLRELIAVIADADNPASPALHVRRGFHDVGRLTRVGYKHSLWLDTIILQLSLTEALA